MFIVTIRRHTSSSMTQHRFPHLKAVGLAVDARGRFGQELRAALHHRQCVVLGAISGLFTRATKWGYSTVLHGDIW